MTKPITTYISAALLALSIMGSASVAQAEDIAISGDLGIYSQYVWRGAAQAGGAASVQGDLNLDIMEGLSANAWFASLNGPATEFDFTVDYSGEIDGITYSVGAIVYTYLNVADGNASEVYAVLGYGPVSLTYYYAVDGSWDKDAYLAFDIGHSMMGLDFGGTVGYLMPNVGTSEVTHVDVSISKDIEVGELIFTPSFMVSFPTYTAAPANSTQFVGGMNAAF